MGKKPSLLESALRELSKAEEGFARASTDANDQQVRRMRQLVANEKDRERRRGGPIRPPDSN